jgi:hypothetical protein
MLGWMQLTGSLIIKERIGNRFYVLGILLGEVLAYVEFTAFEETLHDLQNPARCESRCKV